MLAITLEQRVGFDRHLHIEIARRAAISAGLAFACQADAVTRIDTGRHLDRQGFAFFNTPLTVTVTARIRNGFALAVTGGTGDYADAPAELDQVLLGMSDGYGVRLQIELGGGSVDTFGEEDHTEWDSGFQIGPIPTSGSHEAG